ncbi:MAG: hypothetical protein AAGM21_02325 [Pseudomonadota bacterium]
MQLAFIILGAIAGLSAFATSLVLGSGVVSATVLLSFTATAVTLGTMLFTAYSRPDLRL